MSSESDSLRMPEGFAGHVRLFPLPNLVMFPHAMQLLHLFEPRYCELLRDALDGDRLIATALLQPGWEADYDGRPPIEEVICIGRVETHQEQGDGTHNILLAGLERARIVRELPAENAFREAEIELLADDYPATGATQRPVLRRQLMQRLRHLVSQTSAAQEHLDQLFATPLPLGVLTDFLAHAENFSLAFKQQLLAQLNVDRRAELLLDALGEEPGESSIFPPPFSSN